MKDNDMHPEIHGPLSKRLCLPTAMLAAGTLSIMIFPIVALTQHQSAVSAMPRPDQSDT
jgi:hypothetical protein